MELPVKNRIPFGPMEDERRVKARSLDAPYEESQKAFEAARERAKRREPLIDAALNFAKSLDFQSSLGKSYLSHPLRVATFLLNLEPSIEIDYLQIALLHNVLETARIQPAQLEERFGKGVAGAIQALTVDRTVPFEKIETAYYQKLQDGGHRLMLVKLLDKMDNLFVLCINPDADVREKYLAEIERRLLPFTRAYNSQLAQYLQELVLDARRTGFKSKKEIA